MAERDIAEEIDNTLKKHKTDWSRIEAMTGAEALRRALADPDNPPLTDEQLARMRRVPNPQEIRESMGLTQREFARQFQIALGTLRDWEQGARRPDSAARAYLRVIADAPETVRHILHPHDFPHVAGESAMEDEPHADMPAERAPDHRD